MTIEQKSNRGQRRILLGMYAVALFLFLSVAGEVMVRLFGYRPFAPEPIQVTVEPGRRFFTNHPALGYCQLTGEFKVTLVSNFTFKATHGTNGLRVTHSPRENAARRPEIWIMGCSYTYGWGINDEETYPWLLQAKFPQYEIVNFGVNGYGTLQSMIQFKEALKERGKPVVVAVAYAGFHDERNTFPRTRRKAVAPYNRLGPLQQPFARLGSDGGVDYFLAPVEYTELPLMRYSALVHFFEQQYDRFEDRLAKSSAVSCGIMKEFNDLCRGEDVPFFVARITKDESLVPDFCRREGIVFTDLAIDLHVPGYRNVPYDYHPSAKANQEFAAKLETYLKSSVLPKVVK